MAFDPSCIVQFSIPGDAANIYCMVDERVVDEAKAALTPAQQSAVDGYRWAPSAQQIADGQAPAWAGNDPQPIYFRTTLAKMKAALARRWSEIS